MGIQVLCTILILFSSLIQHAQSRGELDIQFLSFNGNGYDSSGSCCELFCSDACDPYFIVCIGLNKKCEFYRRQSSVYHERNSIAFSSNIGGLANPIVLTRDPIPTEFTVRVIVWDNDPTTGNDHMGDSFVEYSVRNVTTNGTKGEYHLMQFGNGRTRFRINVRVYCDLHYYGNSCQVYCVEDSGGRYGCDFETGERVCNEGWTGPECEDDVDECRLNVSCPNGTNCTDAALDCDGCYINDVCHNGISCSNITDYVVCDGCFLFGVCFEATPCGEVFDALDCPGCYVDGACQFGEDCSQGSCDGCFILGHCFSGVYCADIDEDPLCDGCLVAGVCHAWTPCDSIDWEPPCEGCTIDHVCEHGGQCENLPGSFNCTCQTGFEGDTCGETVHECVINPCQYGGSCTGNETSYTCDCLPWRGGIDCETEVDTCEEEVCYNNATCISNNHTLPGFTCMCQSDWAGPTCEYLYGDTFILYILGELNNETTQALVEGLENLINELGGIEGEVYVRVNTNTSTVDGRRVTVVELQAGGEEGTVNRTVYETILDNYTLERINSYLPFSVYTVIPDEEEPETAPWINSKWYIVVIAVVAALVLIVIVVVILFLTRKHWNRKLIFLRSESTISNATLISKSSPPSTPGTIAVENPLYTRNQSLVESEAVDQEDISLSLNPTLQSRSLPSPPDLDIDPLYTEPVPETNHYDTPVKQAVENEAAISENEAGLCALNALETKCESGSNPYTDFNHLEGGKEECPYTELDEIAAMKVANALGFLDDLPEDKADETKSDIESEDSEDDIDRIKASIKERQSEA